MNDEWTSEKVLDMKLKDISDLLQECYKDNRKNGVEEARVRLYAKFPDTGQRMVLTVSLSEVEE